jgi:hypothetical protein
MDQKGLSVGVQELRWKFSFQAKANAPIWPLRSSFNVQNRSNIAVPAATLLSPASAFTAPVPGSDPVPLTIPRSDPVPLTAALPSAHRGGRGITLPGSNLPIAAQLLEFSAKSFGSGGIVRRRCAHCASSLATKEETSLPNS